MSTRSKTSRSQRSQLPGSGNRKSINKKSQLTQKRRPISQSTTTYRLRPNSYLNKLDKKFLKLKNMKSEIALEKAKEIIEAQMQNTKGSIDQGKKAYKLALKYWRQSPPNYVLGNCYFLLSLAIFSLNVGSAPRATGSQMGGPIRLGVGTTGTADSYLEWQHIDIDMHKLPKGYGQLERRMRRAYNKSKRKKLKTIEVSKGGRRKKTKKKTKKKTRKKYRKKK